ncbi:MAG: hypothetical protein MUO82_05205 [Candidatus Thermoplasmatota archaeon]|nr:hypothetical protein [Candidatus Thermoplasmatota archaeon]
MDEARVVQVNIWKELQKEITKTIGVLRGLVVLTHGTIKINKKKVEAVKIQIKTKKTRY